MLLYNNLDNLNTIAPEFNLKSVYGNYYSLSNFTDKRIIVIIFMCNHCPYVKSVINRIVLLQEYFNNQQVQFIGINSNDIITFPEDSFENMIKFSNEYSLNFPYLIDETQEIALKFNAVCTPDIYVYDENRILKYRGRLDDSWKDENKVTKQELKVAVEILLEGKQLNFNQIPSMGCSIKWK
jgi:peroxiredoxin